jgi:hypothetical protein
LKTLRAVSAFIDRFSQRTFIMNPLMEEYLIEEHRKDIKRGLSHSFAGKVLKSRVFRPSWFTHAMQRPVMVDRARWRPQKRYEVPAKMSIIKQSSPLTSLTSRSGEWCRSHGEPLTRLGLFG